MDALVSIIMPVYNAEQFVGDAIQSVIEQSWQAWELIVIDDGSTDLSREIIASFNDSRIRYFYKKNGGVSSARNVGFQQMHGNFFCFLDADDVLPVSSLEDRLAVFDDQAIHFVDGSVKVFDVQMENVLRQWIPSFHGNTFNRLIRIDDRVFFGPSWMIRRKADQAYRMDESLRHCEDLFFYITIAQQGNYSFTPACTLHYRRNAGSAMSDFVGLARGYTQLRRRLKETFGRKISGWTWIVLHYKTRKIMFLSFVSVKNYRDAFRYLVMGRI